MPQNAIPVSVVGGSSAGKLLFVNEAIGHDSNSGLAASPFATIDAALAAATANHGDTVFLVGTSHRTTTLNWNKSGVNLVGLTSPSGNDRARISSSGSTVFTPMVNVTGSGCSFVDIATFYGYVDATAQVCWAEAGGRNFYSGCQFLGGGNATGAAQAGMRSLTISGSGENLFLGCSIGLDTVVRATNPNASLELLAGTPRNRFRECTFQALSTLAGNVHVLVGAGGMDRYCWFDNCAFLNAVESTGTAMDAAIAANAAAGGAVVLSNCISLGATAIATTGPVYVDGGALGATTRGIAIKAT